MQPPCEIMVTDFLPNIRGVVSHELRERGESQRRIATLLGITQARVSYYLGRKKSFFLEEMVTRFGISQNDLQSFGKILADDVVRNQADGIFTLYSIWKNLLFTGAICGAHQRESGVPSDCSVCMELHRSVRESPGPGNKESEDAFILREISNAIANLEASPYFPFVMPEVSVNIAMSRENPKTSRDIAAIPGRINKIHGRAKSFVLPEFGCSNHMSKVLLIANSRNREFRAALNLKYDSTVERALSELGITKKVTENRCGNDSKRSTKSSRKTIQGQSQEPTRHGSPDDPVIDRIASTRLPSQGPGEQPIALTDRGSEGLEPMTYLIGKKATDIAEAATKIAHACFGYQIERDAP